ncbi:DOMON domain-containing protein FRRS1L-like [Liolophura sinensis]|uniref:DOMON domain-containing protein FRRS1L-like n=1 Tax=Liolophura sinensis TaxID=3198878 RepID=UPI003158A883
MNTYQTTMFVVVAIVCTLLTTWITGCANADSFMSKEQDTTHNEAALGIPQSRRLLEYRRASYTTLRDRGQVLISRWKRYSGNNRRGNKHHKMPRRKDKRSVESGRSVDNYPGFHINVSSCGVDKNCVRFGSPNCGHRECTYMFTFRVIGDTVELELSAKTQGWVAIGFSSDKKMGADDVIACVRSVVPSKIRALFLINPYSHEKPHEKDIPVNLTAAEYKDGYLSCRTRRAVSIDGAMDLTNDWFHLYAWGSVGASGLMMRHDLEKPPTSTQSYSIIRKNVNVVRQLVSGAEQRYIGCVSLVAFVLIHALAVN